MNDYSLNVVRESAYQFRNALEQLKTSDHPSSSWWFVNFPKGCCGDTSDLLAKYLLNKGIKTEYVWGMAGERSHAWLEYEGYIIDITADQFDEINEKIVITQNKSWYLKFKGQRRFYNDFTQYNDYNAARLSTIYNNILNKLNT